MGLIERMREAAQADGRSINRWLERVVEAAVGGGGLVEQPVRVQVPSNGGTTPKPSRAVKQVVLGDTPLDTKECKRCECLRSPYRALYCILPECPCHEGMPQ